jgi:heat shock protein 1/8
LIGESAKNQAAMNPKNTIFDIKLVFPPLYELTGWSILMRFLRRLIGRRFDDPTVKKDIESWPFKVVDQEGSPMVEVEYLGENKIFSPQEVSAMVLTKVIQL